MLFAYLKRIYNFYRFWREPKVYGHGVRIGWSKEQFVVFVRGKGEVADWLRTCSPHRYNAYTNCCWIYFFDEMDAVECKLKFA